VPPRNLDCMAPDAQGSYTPGQRCVMQLDLSLQDFLPQCANTSCSAAGEFLIDGEPCDSGAPAGQMQKKKRVLKLFITSFWYNYVTKT
jgi:hypothetical protein